MSKIYISQVPGGHEVQVDATYEAGELAESGWSLEQIDRVIAGEDDLYGEDGASVTVIDLPSFVIVVTWEEPETGVVAFGPYGDERSAEADWGRVSEQFLNDGVLPEDVEYRVVECSS